MHLQLLALFYCSSSMMVKFLLAHQIFLRKFRKSFVFYFKDFIWIITSYFFKFSNNILHLSTLYNCAIFVEKIAKLKLLCMREKKSSEIFSTKPTTFKPKLEGRYNSRFRWSFSIFFLTNRASCMLTGVVAWSSSTFSQMLASWWDLFLLLL